MLSYLIPLSWKVKSYIKKNYNPNEKRQAPKAIILDEYAYKKRPIIPNDAIATSFSIKYSISKKYDFRDDYDEHTIRKAIENYETSHNLLPIMQAINATRSLSFSEYVLYFLKLYKFESTDVYKRANIDRRVFSKILCEPNYQPSRDTAIALTIGLQLSKYNAYQLLESAGYTFSKSSTRDLIILYFIENEIYDLYKINDLLVQLEEKTIGK